MLNYINIMDKFIFIIVLVVILLIIKFLKYGENFDTQSPSGYQDDNSGIYNYFYMRIMNPYSLPMRKFFQNDTQKPLPPNQNY